MRRWAGSAATSGMGAPPARSSGFRRRIRRRGPPSIRPNRHSPQDRAKADVAYDRIALSIAAFEASAEVNSFSSKYDATTTGKAKLTALEQRGLTLLSGKAGCTACHPSNGKMALLTD